MPRITDEKIRKLCQQAVNVTDSEEMERLFAELRRALHEHTVVAKSALKSQAARFAHPKDHN